MQGLLITFAVATARVVTLMLPVTKSPEMDGTNFCETVTPTAALLAVCVPQVGGFSAQTVAGPVVTQFCTEVARFALAEASAVTCAAVLEPPPAIVSAPATAATSAVF